MRGLIGAQRLAQCRFTLQGRRLERFATAGDDVDQLQHMVAALEQHRDQPGVDCHTAVAQTVEYVLDDVREADDGVQAEQTGGTLDGVRGTKNRADGILVSRLGFQLQQGLLHDLQQFVRLYNECLQCLVEIDAHLDLPCLSMNVQ